jgi:hypothetical protein
MVDQPSAEFGPDAPTGPAAAPFSITGPSAATLDAARKGMTSFVVANVTGRPVTARLIVQPLNGADLAWFSIDPPTERPMTVAATLSVDIKIDVGEKAPAGEHAVRLDVAVEDSPNLVASGPTATFTVPEVVKKKKFPWWIIAVIVGALILIGGGIFAILAIFGGDKDPELVTAPTISGAPAVGETLTVGDGVWDPEEVVRLHVWQSCPGGSDPEDPEGCEDIVVGTGDAAVKVTGDTFVVGNEQEGLRIRVVEVALVVDPDDVDGMSEDELADLPSASAASAVTEAVPVAAPSAVTVPNVVGDSIGVAQSKLAGAGLQTLLTFSGTGTSCSPTVTDQDPNQGTSVQTGTAVGISAQNTPPECFVFDGPIFEIPEFLVPEINNPIFIDVGQ